MAHHDALTDLPNRVLLQRAAGAALAACAAGEVAAVLCSTSTTSRTSTTRSATRSATSCCSQVADRLRALRARDRHGRPPRRRRVRHPAGGIASRPTRPSSPQRIIEAVSAPFEIDGHQVVIGTSIGIAMAPGRRHRPRRAAAATPTSRSTAPRATAAAPIRFFEPEMDAQMQARRDLETRPAQGARRPASSSCTTSRSSTSRRDEISGFEALLRWHHPDTRHDPAGRLHPARRGDRA